jgi:hypothetical protein
MALLKIRLPDIRRPSDYAGYSEIGEEDGVAVDEDVACFDVGVHDICFVDVVYPAEKTAQETHRQLIAALGDDAEAGDCGVLEEFPEITVSNWAHDDVQGAFEDIYAKEMDDVFVRGALEDSDFFLEFLCLKFGGSDGLFCVDFCAVSVHPSDLIDNSEGSVP